MKFKIGASYKTREGEIVKLGKTDFLEEGKHPFLGSNGFYYTNEGKILSDPTRDPTEHDLVKQIIIKDDFYYRQPWYVRMAMRAAMWVSTAAAAITVPFND